MLLTKEEINALPLGAYMGDVRLVRSEEELEDILPQLEAERILGFDTETRPIFTRPVKNETNPAPALLQLAGEERVYLFQLSACPFGGQLAKLLENPAIVKAGVAIRDDMRALARHYAFEAHSAIDLANLAKTRGVKAQGLRSLAASLLGLRISKSARCSRWDKKNLSKAQILYAATDAWLGRELYLRLIDMPHAHHSHAQDRP